jgi:hypothetical protein
MSTRTLLPVKLSCGIEKMYEEATGFKAAGSDNSGYLTKASRSPSMAETGTSRSSCSTRPGKIDADSRDEYTDIGQRFIAASEGARLTSIMPRS